MIKKVLVLVLAAALVLPVLVRAEEGVLKTKPLPAKLETFEANKLERADKLNDLKNKVEERRAENQEKRENRVSNYLRLASERISRTLMQLENLLAKADKYIAQLASRGADVTKVRTAQTEAKTALDDARAALADLPNRIATPTNVDKLTTVEAKTIRGTMENVTKLTKVAAEKVQALIKLLRGIKSSILTVPSTSNTINTTPTPSTDTAPERVN